jgi:hypothetical protein
MISARFGFAAYWVEFLSRPIHVYSYNACTYMNNIRMSVAKLASITVVSFVYKLCMYWSVSFFGPKMALA